MIARDEFERAVAQWIADGAIGFRQRNARSLCVGVCAPQGAGKSTLCERLVSLLRARSLSAVTVSIDDVYLTRDEQAALSALHPSNRYLEARGYPGTHDVALGERTIDALAHAEAGASVRVPSYDKGAFGGAGDRRPANEWPVYTDAPFDVVLFEGWMLAFSPVEPAVIRDDPSLLACNELLRSYEGWRARMDRWVLFEGARVEFVIDWRIEAEQRRRAADGRGMSDAQARAYIERFLPAYRCWGARALATITQPVLHATLRADRSVDSLEAIEP